MASVRNERGVTLMEVLVAVPVLAIGILAIASALTLAHGGVVSGGGQSKATNYARGVTRTRSIAPVAGTAAPNRLARITVTVGWQNPAGAAQGISLETMRAEQ